jgi:hypothetical protein
MYICKRKNFIVANDWFVAPHRWMFKAEFKKKDSARGGTKFVTLSGKKFLFEALYSVGRARVTRLGDFSPIRQLSALGTFFENGRISPDF